MTGIALQGTVSNEVQLAPKTRVALLKDLRAHAKLKQQIKDLEAQAKALNDRVNAVREAERLDKFEIDGFSVTLVAPVREVLDKQKLVALGCKIEWLTKATEKVPTAPYCKITAPKVDR